MSSWVALGGLIFILCVVITLAIIGNDEVDELNEENSYDDVSAED